MEGLTPSLLVLLGDSLLAEIGSNRNAMIEQQLGDEWTVLNCATSGFTAAQARRHAAYLTRLRPTAVLVSVGTNDAAPDRGVDEAEFEHDLRALLGIFADARRLVLLPPGVDDARRAPADARDDAAIDRFRAAAARAAEREGADSVDGAALSASVRSRGDDPFVADGVHLTDAMYDALAGELGRLLR